MLNEYQTSINPAVRLRAQILLLLYERVAWSLIATLLFASPSMIARWKQRFVTQGIAGASLPFILEVAGDDRALGHD